MYDFREEVEAFKKLQVDVKSIRDGLDKMNEKSIEDTWLDSKQVQKILGISQKTWQTYRDRKMIKFSQVGQKIYVRNTWLEDFLEKYSINNK